MKLNANQVAKINEAIESILGRCDYFADQRDDLIFSEERIKDILEEEEDIESIDIDFPVEADITQIDTEDFLALCDDIKTIDTADPGVVKTALRRYYIVDAANSNEDRLMREQWAFSINTPDGISINLVAESVIVGLAATYLDEYDRDWWGTYSQYLAVEIIYSNSNIILSPAAEQDLVQSYLFEVADSTGISLSRSEIRSRNLDYDYFQEEEEDLEAVRLRDLEPYNDGMRLFVSALQIEDPALRFLSFYKVLEHFSPIAVNIEANELMRKKLDAPKSTFEDGDYIRSIFNLADAMRDRFNDEDLIKASLSACVDFVGIFKHLPDAVSKAVLKQIKERELTYSTHRQKLTTACNMVGKVIYRTRNQVVHAKSNFLPTGDEVATGDLPDLNRFMRMASSQAIRWYSRQPSHLKRETIS